MPSRGLRPATDVGYPFQVHPSGCGHGACALRACREDTACVARRYLGASAAADALQDACAEAFLQLGTLAFPERFGEWLCTIVRNCCIWLLRGRVRQVSYEEISRLAPHPQFDFAA